jgi:hypothetical protein
LTRGIRDQSIEASKGGDASIARLTA